MEKNYYEELEKYDIDTYGFEPKEILERLDEETRLDFLKATEAMEVRENRALVQAVFDLASQAHFVGVDGPLARPSILIQKAYLLEK